MVLFGIVLAIAFVLFRSWNFSGLASNPRPVRSYDEAVARIEKLRAQESVALNPLGRLRFMTHQHKVERVIVFVHGYTNCPEQFSQLGKSFFERGYNVLILPLPYHGLADRMTAEHAKLTAEDLVSYTDETMDIAQGLGEQVVMVGLSAGGNITAWAAQHRPELDLAVIMAPVFGYKQIPRPFIAPLTKLCLQLPNSFIWWEPSLKAAGGVPHSYPRFSTRAIAQILRLGFAVQAKARHDAPVALGILVITNANDSSVSTVPINELVANWRKYGANIKTYQYPSELQLGHDFIDSAQPYAKIKLSYPPLIDLILNFK